MTIKLWMTLALSVVICFINFYACKNSKLGSTKAILIDSVIDLMFPVVGLIALANPNIDFVLSIIQMSVLSIMVLYIFLEKLLKPVEPVQTSKRGFMAVVASMLLTILCMSLVKDLFDIEKPISSIGVIITHFQVDLTLKLSVIVMYLIEKSSLKLKTSANYFLDLSSMLMIMLFTANGLRGYFSF